MYEPLMLVKKGERAERIAMIVTYFQECRGRWAGIQTRVTLQAHHILPPLPLL